MLNFLLYTTATLIWGSTWLGIKLQLTQVPPILSVGYRFCLAALILLVFCLITRKRLVFSLRDQFFMAIQGFTLFGLGYCMSYLATSYLTSGLVSVVYTTILMPIIALLLSTFFEAYHWRLNAGLGVTIVLIGNLVTLTPAVTWRKLFCRLSLTPWQPES